MNRHHRFTKYTIVLAIFIIAVFFRCYRFSDKETLFLDEALTVVLSNYSSEGWYIHIQDDSTIFKGQELTSRLFGEDDLGVKEMLIDVYNLRRHSRDLHHTNLYYSLFRLSTLSVDRGDMDAYLLRGFLLNLFLFSIGFIFLYKTARLLFKDNILLIACALLLAYLTPLSIGNTLFFRCYQLQEMLMIALTYVFVRLEVNKHIVARVNWWQILPVALLVALCALSGYLFLIYIALLSVVFLLVTYRQGNKKLITQYFVTMLISFVFTLIIYPPFLSPLYHNESANTFSRFNIESLHQNLDLSINALIDVVYTAVVSKAWLGVLFALIVILMLQRFIASNRDKKSFLVAILFFTTAIWCVLVMYTAPYKTERYIAPAFPILLLIVPWLISHIQKVWLQYAFVGLFVGFLLIKCIETTNVYWSMSSVPIDHQFENNTEAPMIIVGAIDAGIQVAMYPYYTPGRDIELAFDQQKFVEKLNKHDELYVVFHHKYINEYVIPQTYMIVDTISPSPPYAIGYKVSKKLDIQDQPK